MTPRAHNHRDEYVYIFYGINRNTFEVEEVWNTRGNMLSRDRRRGSADSRRVPVGVCPHDAAATFYGLSDMVPIVVCARDSEFAKLKIAQLTQKALKMKEDARFFEQEPSFT